MSTTHPYFTYTAEVLSWRLGGPPQTAALPPSIAVSRTDARVARVVRAARNHPEVRLLGLGTGALAAALAEALPPQVALTVLSLDPAAALPLREAGHLAWITPDGPRQLLTDTSRQALFCLPAMVAATSGCALVTVNPEPCPEGEREGLANLRRLFQESRRLPEPSGTAESTGRSLTLAVLARPEEPDLSGFFAACAGLADQAVIVWDAPEVPEVANQAALLRLPVRHLARPLGDDFAAQRNALLAACPPGWVLSLDPDERPGPTFPATVTRLRATPGLAGAYFPRLTLYPDAGHVKMGYGLWPDLQLRLFDNTPPSRPTYVRPVHERLEGLHGPVALALDAPLLHYNRLLADDAAVSAKLAHYNAACGAPRHRLNRAYPALPLDFFTALTRQPPPGRVLLLPALW